MKIRKGFVSNSSSSSFILAYEKEYYADDPNLMDEISGKDDITIKKHDGDSYTYYTLTDDDKKKFFENIDTYKKMIDYVCTNAEELGEDFFITPEMVGKHVVSSAGQDDYIDHFDSWSESLEEFLGDE